MPIEVSSRCMLHNGNLSADDNGADYQPGD